MITLLALAGCLGEAALIHATMILLHLSRKLGEVTKMKPFYRAYYLSILFLAGALILRFVNASLSLTPMTPDLPTWQSSHWLLAPLPHNILLALGLTIAFIVTLKYWGWLVEE